MKSLLKEKVEFISKSIFEKYNREIVELMKGNYGVYALYDENELYYVGKAKDLTQRIIQHHLKTRHKGAWTHFSLYLTANDSYINEIESLLISIAKPRGNKSIPKGQATTKLKKLLEQKIKEKHKEELSELGLSKKVKRKTRSTSQSNRSLKNLFRVRKTLTKTYKGKDLKAILHPSGKICFEGKFYNTPSGAANAARKTVEQIPYSGINGWTFWFIQNDDRNWVKLADI